MENNLKKAAECFIANPATDKFYQTTDGLCFSNQQVAEQHGHTLGSTEEARKVSPIKRDDIADQIAELEGKAGAEGNAGTKGNAGAKGKK
jgi:hypothetical protein